MRNHPQSRAGRRAGLAALALALALAGCTGSSSGDRNDNGSFVAGDGVLTVLQPDRRGEPIALAGDTLEGTRLDLASLRGRTVVLNVWGSWCGPCRKEAPDLVTLEQQLKSQDVAFVGLNVREEDPAQARAFQRAFAITYPSLSDEGGNLLLSLRGAVAPNAIPTTLVLDGEGRIAARISGGTTRITLKGVVESVISGTPLAELPASSGTP